MKKEKILVLNNPDVVYENIRKIRQMRDIKQEEIASALGINQKHYSRIERGEVDITFKRLCEIANFFQIKVQTLINAEEMKIFQNINQLNRGGNYYNYNATDIQEVKALYERLIKEKDETIESLKSLVKEMKKNNKD